MIYILNTSLKEEKRCAVALSEIFGLGQPLIYQICDQLGISGNIKCKALNVNQIDRLTRCISQNYVTDVELRGIISKNKERLVFISSFRGFRLIEGLPCRGQRTHGNAQTARKRTHKGFSSRLGKGGKKR